MDWCRNGYGNLGAIHYPLNWGMNLMNCVVRSPVTRPMNCPMNSPRSLIFGISDECYAAMYQFEASAIRRMGQFMGQCMMVIGRFTAS